MTEEERQKENDRIMKKFEEENFGGRQPSRLEAKVLLEILIKDFEERGDKELAKEMRQVVELLDKNRKLMGKYQLADKELGKQVLELGSKFEDTLSEQLKRGMNNNSVDPEEHLETLKKANSYLVKIAKLIEDGVKTGKVLALPGEKPNYKGKDKLELEAKPLEFKDRKTLGDMTDDGVSQAELVGFSNELIEGVIKEFNATGSINTKYVVVARAPHTHLDEKTGEDSPCYERAMVPLTSETMLDDRARVALEFGQNLGVTEKQALEKPTDNEELLKIWSDLEKGSAKAIKAEIKKAKYEENPGLVKKLEGELKEFIKKMAETKDMTDEQKAQTVSRFLNMEENQHMLFSGIRRIIVFGTITEAWYLKGKPGDKPETIGSPSKSKDKKECITITLSSRDGKQFYRMIEIVRKDGRVYAGEDNHQFSEDGTAMQDNNASEFWKGFWGLSDHNPQGGFALQKIE